MLQITCVGPRPDRKGLTEIMASKFTVTQSQNQPHPLPVVTGMYQWYCARGESCDNEQAGVEDLYYMAGEVGDSSFLVSIDYPQIALATKPPVEDWLKFQGLVTKWREERGVASSITQMVCCLSYQSIIGMGSVAIPLILAQLESEGNEPDHWFWALRVLTGENPVREEDRGNPLRMAQSWLQWAENRDYAW